MPRREAVRENDLTNRPCMMNGACAKDDGCTCIATLFLGRIDIDKCAWTPSHDLNYSVGMSKTSEPFDGRRWHDMGGTTAGPIPTDQHDFALWEKRVDALMVICSTKGYFTVDGLRRVLEDMAPETFETMTYYERWIASVNQNLIEAGVYSTAELAARMSEVAARGPTYGEAADG